MAVEIFFDLEAKRMEQTLLK
ncbi:hypothetical protein CCACVL1_23312 [Corchorus capsularis]|uniref:Uncharacterized protein n=1 Tax=Corchorus capsularis TaxID=210143 RepID=A0A1R3GU93_COCAP|nr:hypothetical protein CCACVL1_23312 [Corchorus capsularis]